MTVIEPMYFEEIIGRLRDRGHDVRHFALLADRDTVLLRLRERGFGQAVRLIAGRGASLRRESFAVAKLDECLERLREPLFAEQVWTDDLSVSQVADRIAGSATLTLTPNEDNPLRVRLRRVWTGAKHIRFD